MTIKKVELTVGDTAPNFCLQDKDNSSVCLKDFKGKYVIVYFYPKDNTGISPDSPESHAKFIEKKNLKVTLLSDLDKAVIKSYGKWGKRTFRGKEYMGVARSTFLINPDGKIAYVWAKVSVGRHPKEVQKKLVELKS